MSRIFVDRPIFAWVIAIVVMLAGVGAILTLPVEQFPDIAPPQVNISARYPGASAETLETSVTQVIEQQITGVDGLLYFSANSSSQGQVRISATFAKGTNPDIAQVQVQNKVQQALSRLPQIVQAQGITVTKSNPDQLMVVALYDESDRVSATDISDFALSQVQDVLARIPGVGQVDSFGAQYAMRVWLDPNRLAAYSLIPGDVVAAITAQNAEVAAGEIGGQPSPPGQMLNAIVTAQSRLTTADQFRRIVVKTRPDGSTVLLSDVARVELGSDNYIFVADMNHHPAAGIGISLTPGADALKTAKLVKEEMARQATRFPPGFRVIFPSDSTLFIKKSIEDVVITLVEAIVLVVIVIFAFLQSWRATLIPAIAVPVVLLGTFGVFALVGFSINTLTLFGMVLAIGLLVDDAIVVVENVERLMHENPGMTPREATIRSMREISVALVAIALVLSAVFLPMALLGGSTGVIYRQFSLTIVAAMALSVGVALILSPALTATLLKRREDEDHTGWVGRASWRMHEWFEANFARLVTWYHDHARRIAERKKRPVLVYLALCALLALLFLRLPTGFLPGEDQGRGQLIIQLPPGATLQRTDRARSLAEDHILAHESRDIANVFTVVGGGANGAVGQNTGRGFINFRDWDERKGSEHTADAVTRRITKALSGIRDLEFYATVPAVVRGLGQSSGFTAELVNDSSLPRERFDAIRDRILAEARADPQLANVRLSTLPEVQTLAIQADNQKLAVLGLNQADVNATLSTAWGGRYVNDFVDRGRVKRVYVQGDAPWRSRPEDLAAWQVRGSNGQMVPFTAFATAGWSRSPTATTRFNGIPAYEFSGQAVPGASSGQAMDAFSRIVAHYPGVGLQWAGASYQERLATGQGPLLYGLSLVVVFLCLAALYESWSIPVAVLLVIPLGLVGAVLAVTLRGLQNDVYLQIGLLTTMGLAAKNAILMIEFAEQEEKKGASILDAAMTAARLRLRPILMTSAAFIFGVLPLAIATGAGANSRIAIGTAVIGGMLTATALAVFFIPLFFVIVRATTRDLLQRLRGRPRQEAGA